MGVELTGFGKAFFKEAKIVKAQLEALMQLGDRYDEQCGTHINFGIRGNFGSAFALKQQAEVFQAMYPDVNVEFISCENMEMETLVQDGAIDVAFSILPPTLPCLEAENILDIELSLLVRSSDPIAGEKAVTAQMLHGRKLVVVTFSDHTCRILSDFFRGTGFEPEIEYVTADLSLMHTLVLREGYVGVTISRDAEMGVSAYSDVVSSCFDPPLYLHQGLLTLKGRLLTPMHKLFIAHLKENFHGMDYIPPETR